MKRLLYIILLPLLSYILPSCAPKFSMEYDSLRLDYTEFTVAASEEKILVAIYYSGSWEASLTDGGQWARLEKETGSGITNNRVLLMPNTGPARKAVLTIKADNGDQKQVNIIQKASSGAYVLFEPQSIALPADALTLDVPMVTNMGDDVILPMFEGFKDESGVVTVYEISQADSIDGGVRRQITLKLAENTSGQERNMTLPLKMKTSDGEDFGTELTIAQDAQKAYLRVKDKVVVNRNAAEYSYALEHNLGFLADSLKATVSYPESQEEFVSDLSLSDGLLSFTVSETQKDRYAGFEITMSDFGMSLKAEMEFSQMFNLVPREISVSDLKDLFIGESQEYSPDDIYTDYVRMYVVGGAGNPNMEQNINTGPNEISTDENDRTVYLQDKAAEATAGVRVKFADKEYNTLSHGDQVKLFLEGCTLKKSSAPEGFTIEGLKDSSVEVLSEDNEITPNVRSVASLSPSDMYTYCTLENMEFQVKNGAFTNVREYAAINNPLTSESLTVNYKDTGRENSKLQTASQFAMDGAANLLYDASGDVIYALFNMGCNWRREQAPSGSGSVTGVIVHQDMPRWGGNIGAYSIRPISEEDFNMESASTWTTLAEWVLTKEDTSTDSYSWKHGQNNENGYSNDFVDKVLAQNKMCATGGDASALIYSENLDGRTAGNGTHGKKSSPVSIEWGYRGLDMSSPDKADTYGMSKGSAMAFWGNASGWFNWKDNVLAEGYKGIIMEFSTQGVSGNTMSVGFSIASGYPNVSKPTLNIALQSSTSFPVYWTVEYSVGEESWIQVPNEATGSEGFQMRSLPWTLDGTVSYVPHYGVTAKVEVETQSDTGFGLVPYRFNLPADAFGQDKVRVRIRPSSDVIMRLNEDWSAGIASAQLKAIAQSAQKTNVNHAVVLEDVVIQYR